MRDLKAWWNAPITPFFLKLRDSKLHGNFMAEQHKAVASRLKVLNIILAITFSLQAVALWDEIADALWYFLLRIIYVVACSAILIIASKWPSFIEWTTAILLPLLYLELYLMIDMVDTGQAYALNDKKMLLEYIYLGWFTFALFFSINRKIDLLFSFPVGLVGSTIVL